MTRFFVSDELCSDTQIELGKAHSHHAFRVLRMRVGDPIELFNGQGLFWEAELQGDEKCAYARIRTPRNPNNELKAHIGIVQALPEGDKMDWVLEKGTEAGVQAFFPVQAHRSVVRLSAERAAKRALHWQAVCQSASSQSGRARIPHLAPCAPLAQTLQHPDIAACPNKWMLDPKADTRLDALQAVWARLKETPIREIPSDPAPTIGSTLHMVLAIGPEGGWTPEEVRMATDAGFLPLKLSERVYRTETAALVVVSQVTALAGLEP